MNTSRILVVVAHPDDELIFFGGLIHRSVLVGNTVDVLTVCGQFTTRAITSIRRTEFQRSCWKLGARGYHLNFKDSIPIPVVTKELAEFARDVDYHRVYTHGPWGDYGNRDHIDVGMSVSRAFPGPVFMTSGPLEAAETLHLTKEELAQKRNDAKTIYLSQPFAASWCSPVERFSFLEARFAELCARITKGEPEGSDGQCGPTVEETHLEQRLARAAGLIASGTEWAPELRFIPEKLWLPFYSRRAERIRELLRSFSERMRAC